jgi:hypothetical protein
MSGTVVAMPQCADRSETMVQLIGNQNDFRKIGITIRTVF